MSNFDQFFADFCQSGNRFNILPRLTASGKSAGLSAEDIIDRAREAGITNRDSCIRRLWNGSIADPNRHGSWHPSRRSRPAKPPQPPKEKRDFVPVTLRNLGRGATSADIRALSPVPIPPDITPYDEAGFQLYALDQGYDYRVWVGTILDPDFAKSNHRKVKVGDIWDAADIAERIRSEKRLHLPTHVSMLPLTGREGLTKQGKPSFDCADTIAAYPFALLEFDDLALDIQAEIVAGMIRHPKIGVVTVTYSGGKSLHTVIRVPEAPDRKWENQPLEWCETLGCNIHSTNPRKSSDYYLADGQKNVNGRDYIQWQANWSKLAALFASADDPKFRIDLSPATNPATHIRLAGAVRPETGKRQRLLYADHPDPSIF